MMMKEEFKSWRKFLTEKRTPAHDRYEATMYLSIDQSKPIDRTEVMNEMRAIEEVTTVYREREISTSTSVFVGEYSIRFIVPHAADVTHYYQRELKPQLNAIKGLKIQRDLGYEKIGEIGD
jgi:hypothetical protein